MKGPSPRGLWNYAARRLRLGGYFRAPGDGRAIPQIPAQALLWSILIGSSCGRAPFGPSKPG